MKLTHILEADVVDLGKRREQKTQAVRASQANTLKHQMDVFMINIDNVILSTIERLEASGMSNSAANEAVMKHLSDLVMAHDFR